MQLPYANTRLDPRVAEPSTFFDTCLAIVLLGSAMFLPSAVCFLYTGTSQSAGTAIACVLILVVLAWRNPPLKALIPLLVIVIGLVFHLTLALMLTSDQSARAVSSIALFGLVFLAAFTLGSWLFERPAGLIDWTTAILRALLLASAIGSLAGMQPRGIQIWDKAIFPFTEPSHYALVFTPLLIEVCVKSNKWRRYAWLLIGYILAYTLKNLSLAVGTTLAALLTLPILQIGIVALASPVVLLSIDLTYFTERLDFGAKTTNLSTLVYIQGLELIIDSVHRSRGWGIGFQQLGFGPIRSAASEMIYSLTNLELNLQDGGFVAAKFVSEFGIFGIVLTLIFAFVAIKSAIMLRRVSQRMVVHIAGRDFALALILGYTVDMFVRGVAYFTASTLLLMAAVTYYKIAISPRPSLRAVRA
jgi:hypothetical protein